jgi:hypothetical protein
MSEWCRHYRALANHQTCKIGVDMNAVLSEVKAGGKEWGDFPCFHATKEQEYCVLCEPFTQGEIDQEEKEVNAFVEKLNALNNGDSDKCIHCGAVVTSMRKVGRCVYAKPCDCRLWQGNIPPAWKGR